MFIICCYDVVHHRLIFVDNVIMIESFCMYLVGKLFWLFAIFIKKCFIFCICNRMGSLNLTVIVFMVLINFFFFKRKPAYEMRISDWSSDVCSSDLPFPVNRPQPTAFGLLCAAPGIHAAAAERLAPRARKILGRG